MATTSEAAKLIGEVKAIARSGTLEASSAIEKLLEDALKGLPVTKRLRLLEEVSAHFDSPDPTPPLIGLRSAESERVVSLLLGREVAGSHLPAEEISAKLARSLNTLFDTLNRIVGTIDATLLGQESAEETIRQIIGSEIKGENKDRSLQGYLDQIQEAFLIAHEGFKTAARSMIDQILSELDPDKATSPEGVLRFGRLRKAELFEAYLERFRLCRNAFDSGRLMDELLREFEKACRKQYETGRRKL